MLYGAELLSIEARAPFIHIDEKMVNLFIVKLLKLGRNKLAVKHQYRIQLALGIPTLAMDIEKLIHGRIRAWIERRTSTNQQIADRANESLQDVTKLEAAHPLRMALRMYSPNTGDTPSYETAGWRKLDADSRGTQPSVVDRQFQPAQATPGRKNISLVEEKELNG